MMFGSYAACEAESSEHCRVCVLAVSGAMILDG